MKHSTSPTPSLAGSSYAPSYTTSRGQSPLPPPANHTRNCLSATSKSYKYLRRLLKFNQMDFEFAVWQMIYLFISPQKVYRNFNYRKGEYYNSTYIYVYICCQKSQYLLF